jgi:hypothetical protein
MFRKLIFTMLALVAAHTYSTYSKTLRPSELPITNAQTSSLVRATALSGVEATPQKMPTSIEKDILKKAELVKIVEEYNHLLLDSRTYDKLNDPHFDGQERAQLESMIAKRDRALAEMLEISNRQLALLSKLNKGTKYE